MRFEAFEDKLQPEDWRVEAFGPNGECFVAVFSGPNAENRAKAYAAWMNEIPYLGRI